MLNVNTTISRKGYGRNEQQSLILLASLSLILATFLRISLSLIYPVIAVFIMLFYRFRVTSAALILLFLAGLSFLLSLFGGWFLKYKLLSLFHMLPFLLLLFTNPPENATVKRGNDLYILMGCLTVVVAFNDLIGIIQVIRHPDSDDSFTGIYSEFSISLNGLAILNSIIFFYFFLSFIYMKQLKYFLLSAFFFCSLVLGFYGGGLIAAMIAFILSFFTFRIFSVIKTVAIAGLSIFAIYTTMLLVKPDTLDYNIANVKKIASLDIDSGPRKLRSFYNYLISYPKDVKDFLFGSGPGTFNSRSAFMIGSPSYFAKADFIKDKDQPYYFKNYAYTLWNESNNRKEFYEDGFRNQPFSSILAFLGEYGFIFFVLFFIFYYQYYKRIGRFYQTMQKTPKNEISFRFFKFLVIFLPLLLLIDNFLEYPEITLPIILIIKLCHANLLSINKESVYATKT